MRPLTYALTDRDDGRVWYIAAKFGHIMLTDEPNSTERAHAIVYPAARGPLIGRSNIRLFVRGGRLGYELTDEIDAGVSLPPIHPYDLLHRRQTYTLKLPAGFTGTEPLAYEANE